MKSVSLKQFAIFVFLVLAMFVSVARATDYSGSSFIVRDPVISFIAGRATSTNFELYTSDGGSTTGESTSTNFTTRGGFLYFPGPPPPPPPPAPTPPPPPAGGGGGGGPAGTTPVVITQPALPEEELPPQTTVTFSGYAALGMIHILEDGSEVGTSIVNSDGTFAVTVENADPGVHVFSVYVVDGALRQSQAFLTTLTILSETATLVDRIILPPTVEIDQTTVDRGQPITLRGAAVPGGAVLVSLFFGETARFSTTTVDSLGNYVQVISTTGFPLGSYRLQVQAGVLQLGIISPRGQFIPIIVASPQLRLRADLDIDGRVDSVDFATMLFWYRELNAGRRPTPATAPRQNPDLNGDSRVTLTDFSILAFYWTG